ncbi:hypothetical protein [Vitreimonas sp.]|uniref:hypothetical protein n=1 Tax=Vitreimonas sp. TaxID=3069702 RepID=UPI002D78235F|nr:hypothetical protein [Vitreimonas sp.]
MAAVPALAQTAPPLTPTPSATETTSEPLSDGEEANAEPSNDGAEEICRVVQRTESRLRSRRERLCMTRAQWEQMERDAARTARGTGVNSRPRGG